MQSRALDKAAKSMGFPDYATYQAYQLRQQEMRQGPAPVASQPQAAPQQTAPGNWLQNLLQSYHPLGMVAKRLGNIL